MCLKLHSVIEESDFKLSECQVSEIWCLSITEIDVKSMQIEFKLGLWISIQLTIPESIGIDAKAAYFQRGLHAAYSKIIPFA